MWKVVATAALTVIAGPALAEEREYCPARPGLGTPACTTAPGRVSVETGLIDWTVERNPAQRTDTILIGDTLVRIGLADSVEAQFGWTPYGHVRTRNGGTAPIDKMAASGDVTLGLKANLAHPDGSGLSIAVQPFATLPVGRTPVGTGDWGVGLVAPVTYDLSDAINLQFTPEIDAAVDEDGRGRHFAYGGTIGLGVAINDAVSATVEFQALRDDDPADGTTQPLAALSVAWTPNDDLQLDVGGVAGLNDDAPNAELYVGLSRRF